MNDPIQKMLETDLNAALIEYESSRSKSAASQVWVELYAVATSCGYYVNRHDDVDFDLGKKLPPYAVVIATSPKNSETKQLWARNREKYRLSRAITHNDVDANYIDRWTPNEKDLAIMKDLGILWTTPPQQPEPVPEQAACKPRRQSRSDPPEERPSPVKQLRVAEPQRRGRGPKTSPVRSLEPTDQPREET